MEIGQYRNALFDIVHFIGGSIASIELNNTVYFWGGVIIAISMIPSLEASKCYNK